MPAKGTRQTPEARAAIGAKTAAWWSSPEGEAQKRRLREERTGVQTEAHRRAMANAMALQRAINADPVVQARVRDLRRQARDDYDPNAVTEEERAVAAAEEER